MKKFVALLSLVAFMLTAGVASADKGGEPNRGKASEDRGSRAQLQKWFKKWDDEKFALNGKIKSISGTTFVVTLTHTKKNETATTTDVTVKTDSETKFRMLGETPITMADLKVGYLVDVKGKRNGASEFMADKVTVRAEKKMLFGEVVNKTSTTVTLKNSVTGTTTTVPVDSSTVVKINGETKTAADIQVGDKGMVKTKSVLQTMVTKFINLFR
ncbi:MAG TPA: DUF5666 domain-containing protein [Candidatus Binatia bacterium]|nr:DUF5666 domain-containing protein [Candidatus Binatia bacterium]